MVIKSRLPRFLKLDEPLRHGSHKRPTTRRDFLAQGFLSGAATVLAPSALGMLLRSRRANALSTDMGNLASQLCEISAGSGKVPFICFDLAGGANIAGSNVLVGQQGGQLDFLSTAGYSKLGLPGDMLPNSSTTNFVNTEFGLAFHTDSAFLRGMLARTSPATRALVNGAVIPARSENDTGNNPHNPMYGIAKTGAKGGLLTLIGSENSDSGGNSVAPLMMMDPANRPTKVDRNSDVVGLVDTGELGTLFSDPADTVAVMESMARISQKKLGVSPLADGDLTGVPTPVSTGLTDDIAVKDRMRCAYVKTAHTTENFSDPTELNPQADPEIRGPSGIFTEAEFDGEGEYEKTASVMKLVVPGYAGAGTISMGGFDYHTGERATGEMRDFRAGECIGACLEYAAIRNQPLMLYVFSDGSLNSNGMVDDSAGGRGKGVWTGDNQQTAASFFLVLNPDGRPTLLGGTAAQQARHQQLGWFRASGDVETGSSPAANAVNLLVETVILNYLALHGDQGSFAGLFPNHGLGNSTLQDSLTAFAPIV
jgi:hypothetical protein